MFEGIKKLFDSPKEEEIPEGPLGMFITVDFSDHAIERGVDGPKVIKTWYGHSFNQVVEVNSEITFFPDLEIQQFVRDGIPIIDRTRGMQTPTDTIKLPNSAYLLGRTQLGKMVPGLKIIKKGR